MLRSLNHVTVRSADFDRTKRFYCDLLGMNKGAKDGPQGVVDHFALKADDLPAFEQRLKARRPACHALFNRPAGPCVWRQHPRS